MVSSRRRIRRRKRGRNTRRKRKNSGGKYGRGRGQDLRVPTTDVHPALTDESHHLTTAILGQEDHRALGIAPHHPTIVPVAVPSHTIVAERIVMAEKGTNGMTMAVLEPIRDPLNLQTRGIEAEVGVLVDIANDNVAGARASITIPTSVHGIAPIRVPNTRVLRAASPSRTTPKTAPLVLLP